MKKVLALCTEKSSAEDKAILNLALDRFSVQHLDEIVVVENYCRPERSRPGITYLFKQKQQPYELTQCANLALDYLEHTYSEDFILFCAADDSIPASNYVEIMSQSLAPATIHHACGHYLSMPLAPDFESTFVPDYRLRCEVPSLDFALSRISEIGNELILGGTISFIFDERARGLRFDNAYDGAWGYEDTDYLFQLIAAGYRVRPIDDAKLWIAISNWKRKGHSSFNHQQNILGNKNAPYFASKWLGYRSREKGDTTMKHRKPANTRRV